MLSIQPHLCLDWGKNTLLDTDLQYIQERIETVTEAFSRQDWGTSEEIQNGGDHHFILIHGHFLQFHHA